MQVTDIFKAFQVIYHFFFYKQYILRCTGKLIKKIRYKCNLLQNDNEFSTFFGYKMTSLAVRPTFYSVKDAKYHQKPQLLKKLIGR